ncbi:Ig-like domain-containing protein [Cellulomonas hominis]
MKSLAALTAGALLAGAGAVALAGSAAAADEGQLLPGNILWAKAGAYGNFDTLTAADQVWSGASPTEGVNPRPAGAILLDQTCPTDTVQVQAYIRLPQTGVPVNDWDMVSVTGASFTQDSQGRFYMSNTASSIDRLSKPQVFTRNATLPNQTGDYPFIVTCRDNNGIGRGYFEETITFTGIEATNYSWSITHDAWPTVTAPSTTTLAASASSVEAGTAVDLTATVDPSTVSGDVEFFAGSTSLGTAPVTTGTAVLTTSDLPVGSNSITATYVGDGSYSSSTSAPVVVEVTAVAPRATTTVLSVSPASGDPYQDVALRATVTAATGVPSGTVAFKDGSITLGSVPLAAGIADFSTNVLGAGAHSLTAVFAGTAPYTDSTSDLVPADYTLAVGGDEQTVVVTIPQGAITVTTPYTPANPLDLGTAALDPATSTYSAEADFEDIIITDTRAGNLGFTASVVAGPFQNGAGGGFTGQFAGLTGLTATQVDGNALLASSLVLTDNAPFAPGLAAPKVFASYAAGQTTGTAQLAGVFGIDKVPTSVQPGSYTSTVTFTAV